MPMPSKPNDVRKIVDRHLVLLTYIAVLVTAIAIETFT